MNARCRARGDRSRSVSGNWIKSALIVQKVVADLGCLLCPGGNRRLLPPVPPTHRRPVPISANPPQLADSYTHSSELHRLTAHVLSSHRNSKYQRPYAMRPEKLPAHFSTLRPQSRLEPIRRGPLAAPPIPRSLQPQSGPPIRAQPVPRITPPAAPTASPKSTISRRPPQNHPKG